LINLSETDAERVFLNCAERIEQIADLISEAESHLTFNSENYKWESFTPNQRALMAHWHMGCKNAKTALRSNIG